MQQTVPPDLKDQSLYQYATTFFGFGSWEADCWLIGLEERGAKYEDEFCKRYAAWQALSRPDIVDLSDFLRECRVKGAPDWNNQTWRTMHCICRAAGFAIGELCACNARWGGGTSVTRGSGHVALIESMPFPAPSTKAREWPYTEWNQFGIESRASCAGKFFDERLGKLAKMFREHKPKVVITYGRDYTPGRDIRDWVAGIHDLPASEWEARFVERRASRNVHFRLKQFDWAAGNKSLLICVPQPSSYVRYAGGACVPNLIGRIIQERLN